MTHNDRERIEEACRLLRQALELLTPACEERQLTIIPEAVEIRRDPVPTRTYAEVWNRCRALVGLGPTREFGALAKAFAQLHASCQQNVRWGVATIADFFMSDYARDAGWPHKLFHASIDRHAMGAKTRFRNERSIQNHGAGPVGLPADEILSPEALRTSIDTLLLTLQKKRSSES